MTIQFERVTFRIVCERIWHQDNTVDAEKFLQKYIEQHNPPFKEQLAVYFSPHAALSKHIDDLRKTVTQAIADSDWLVTFCDHCGIPIIRDSNATYYQETWGIPTVYCNWCRNRDYPKTRDWFIHVLEHNRHLLPEKYQQTKLERLNERTLHDLVWQLKQRNQPEQFTIISRKA